LAAPRVDSFDGEEQEEEAELGARQHGTGVAGTAATAELCGARVWRACTQREQGRRRASWGEDKGEGRASWRYYLRPGEASGGANPFGDRRRGRRQAGACVAVGRRQGVVFQKTPYVLEISGEI
jgi:hypothetical protein